MKSSTETTRRILRQSPEPSTKGANPKERRGRLKPDLSLMPPAVLVLEAMAMMQGARKYGPYNWRKTRVQARTYIAASMRHIAAWLDGEEVAEDSGIHHLAHARASLGVVMDAQLCDMMVDDRPLTGVAGSLIEAYATRNDPEVGISAKIPEGEPTFCPVLNPDPTRHTPLPTPTPPTFYIAGPMRGITEFNFPAFDKARDLGHNLGYGIISPADLDRGVGFDKDSEVTEEDTHAFVERDVNALLSLSPEMGDGIALLPGWDMSTGALAELFIARWLGLRVVSALTFEEFTDGSPADIIAKALSSGQLGGGV